MWLNTQLNLTRKIKRLAWHAKALTLLKRDPRFA
jgi:hypothetical protein